MDGAVFLVVLGLGLVLGPWVVGFAAWRRSRRTEDRLAALEARLVAVLPPPLPPWSVVDTVPPPAATATPTADQRSDPSALSVATPEAARSRRAPTPTATSTATANTTLEERLALVWFTRAGAATFLLGAAWFFKYAADNDWIGPLGRIALGAITGAGLVALGEARRKVLRALYLHALLGTGVAVLFVSAYASHALYRLAPAPVALAAAGVVALLGGALAVRHRGELVLAVAMAGGLLAPIVLSTGSDRPAALFTWLLLLTGAALWVSVREGFAVVPAIAVGGTALLYAGWWHRFFEAAGPYRHLTSRAVPALAVAAFASSWLWAAAAWRRRRAAQEGPLALEVVALVLAHAGFASLLLDRPALLGAALAALAVLAWRVLERAGRSELLAIPALAGFLALLLSHGEADRAARLQVLWGAASWAVAYLAALAVTLVRHRRDPKPLHLLAAAGAALGLTAVALLATRRDDGLLRSAAAAAGGAALLFLGRALLARARRGGSLLLGVALGLLCASAAFLLTGATITVAWAALAAIVAHLAARERDPEWLAGAGLLFVAVAVRLIAFDLESAGETLVLNPRGLAFGAAAAALFLSGRALAAASEPPFRRAAGAAVGLGHVALLALAVAEARTAAGPARAELVTTLALGLYAAALVALGFAARERLHRWLGLGLFGLTLAKLALHDVWSMERAYQIAVLLAVGALLLGASFLYARHGARLTELLRGRSGAALILVVAGALAAGPASALDERAFSAAARVEGVAGAGLWRFEVPIALYRASAADGLADLRLEGAGGEEVPWLVRSARPAGNGRAVAARLLDPVVLPDGAARAVLDLGPAAARHGEVRLELAGEEFLRRARIESSEDGRAFGVLAEGGRVWAIRGEPRARGDALRYPTSRARFLRVTLLPGGGRVRISGARVTLPPAAPERRTAAATVLSVAREDGRRTAVDVDLGGRTPPGAALRLETGAAAFERTVRVFAGEGEALRPAGCGVVWRAPEAAPDAREQLEVPLAVGASGRVRLVVEDGDAPPLAVTGAALAWSPEEVVFRAAAAGAYRALAGDPEAGRPSYDVAAVLARSPGAVPGLAGLGPFAPNPRHTPPPDRRPFTERHRMTLAVALAALLVGLGGWAVRLLRSAG